MLLHEEVKTFHGKISHSRFVALEGWVLSAIFYDVSSMWGDYHAMELAVYLKRQIENGPYLTFY